MEKKTAVRSCPVCAERAVQTLHHQRFEVPKDYPLPDAFDVVACERCGMVYADTPASQAVYDAYYARFSIYEDTKTSSGGGISATDRKRLSDVADEIARTIEDKDTRIADVGCANGFLLGQLKERGFRRLVGIDPSEGCVRHVRELGVEAMRGSLTDLPGGRFDLVILSHVVEHLCDVRGILSRLSEHGAIYVEVPDAARYKDFIVAPFQDFNTEHINHFSAAALDNLMRTLGYVRGRHGNKVFESSPGSPFPATWGFFHKGAPEPGFSRDGLAESIAEYVAKSRAIFDRMSRTISDVLARSPKVVVWGTGQLAMKLLVDSPLAGANIAALIDGNAANHGRVIRGVTVQPPAALASLPHPVIVTSTIHHDAIARAVQQLGHGHEVVSLRE